MNKPKSNYPASTTFIFSLMWNFERLFLKRKKDDLKHEFSYLGSSFSFGLIVNFQSSIENQFQNYKFVIKKLKDK